MSTLAAKNDLTGFVTEEKVKSMISSTFIDILGGNDPIKFNEDNQIKQCPCNCYLLMYNGSGNTVSISGNNNNDWITLSLANNAGIYLKRGTFVKGKTNVILLPCEKYTKNNWYFDANSDVTSWLVPEAGRYFVEISGGHSGNATITGPYDIKAYHSGAPGRKFIFTIDIDDTITNININVGRNTSDASAYAQYIGEQPWAQSQSGGNSSFLGIVASGGTGASCGGTLTEYGFQWISGSNGSTPNAPTQDEIIAVLPEGITLVSYPTKEIGTFDRGYISITKIEGNEEV